MKKITGIIVGLVGAMLMGSCFGGGGMQQGGEVVGVSGKSFVEPTPYGMIKVEKGFLRVGLTENDTLWGADVPAKEISVDGFWMDQKEITNSQYRQFVQWVRDSIVRDLTGVAVFPIRIPARVRNWPSIQSIPLIP